MRCNYKIQTPCFVRFSLHSAGRPWIRSHWGVLWGVLQITLFFSPLPKSQPSALDFVYTVGPKTLKYLHINSHFNCNWPRAKPNSRWDEQLLLVDFQLEMLLWQLCSSEGTRNEIPRCSIAVHALVHGTELQLTTQHGKGGSLRVQ